MSTILVTGASAGFGRSICQCLVGAGYRVIGAARRMENLRQLESELGAHFYPLCMDVSNKDSVNNALSLLPQSWQEITHLINNAGLALGLDPAHQASWEDWETMIHTNILGLAYLSRQILPKMVARQEGYIINIGSIAGTYPYPGGNIYGATKAFVQQFSLNLRADLAGTPIRVTNIEPGLCGGTEFSLVRFKGDSQRANALYENVEYITGEDIAKTILWLISTPPHMNVNRIEIMPTAQSFGALPVYREN